MSTTKRKLRDAEERARIALDLADAERRPWMYLGDPMFTLLMKTETPESVRTVADDVEKRGVPVLAAAMRATARLLEERADEQKAFTNAHVELVIAEQKVRAARHHHDECLAKLLRKGE